MSASSSDSVLTRSGRFQPTATGGLRPMSSSSRSYRDILGNVRSYSWSDWREDQEEAMWQLFFAISSTIRDNDLPFLDQMEFQDFVGFCQKHTAKPARGKKEQAALETADRNRTDGSGASDDRD